MKVAVYAIALDEAHHVERFLSTAREADLVVVADTGSSDDTVARLEAGGATVHRISVRPWRFDLARTAALALLPADVDVCMSLDLDEVLSEGWRDILEAEWGDATQGDYFYAWSHAPDGSPAVSFRADHIHARFGYRWVHPVHERLVADRTEPRLAHLSFEVHHWPDPSKSRGQYLALLELARDEHPDDAQTSYWLGREYTFHGRYPEAVHELERYLSLPAAAWRQERAASMRYIARSYEALGQRAEALAWYRRAAEEAPNAREPWVDLARACHDVGDWARCYEAATRALAITERPDVYLSDPWAWAEGPYDLASVAAWHLGKQAEAILFVAEAARLAPGDERIAANVTYIREHAPPRS